MKSIDSSRCQVHVLICTNEKPDGRDCCKKVGGFEFFQKFKAKVREEGLAGTYWVTKTGCLGFCNTVGTTVAVHRPGEKPVWFSEVKMEEFDLLWNQIVGQ